MTDKIRPGVRAGKPLIDGEAAQAIEDLLSDANAMPIAGIIARVDGSLGVFIATREHRAVEIVLGSFVGAMAQTIGKDRATEVVRDALYGPSENASEQGLDPVDQPAE